MTSELDLQFSFHKYRKLRIYFAWSAVLLLAFFAKSTVTGFLIGSLFILVGEVLRVWAHGYLRKARRLATNGPYAYVRNPLYLGNFLIGLGFCVIIWHPLIFALFVAGFFSVYWVTVKGEEQRLSFKFQDDFRNYSKAVPRFLPRLTPYRKRSSDIPFVPHRIWGHGEQITLFAIPALFFILYVRHAFYQEHEPFNGINGFAFVLAILFGALTLFSLFWRYQYKKNKKRSRNPKFSAVFSK
jgi:protein-S-isoprenylcysteine O-methyltransferase Ste14